MVLTHLFWMSLVPDFALLQWFTKMSNFFFFTIKFRGQTKPLAANLGFHKIWIFRHCAKDMSTNLPYNIWKTHKNAHKQKKVTFENLAGQYALAKIIQVLNTRLNVKINAALDKSSLNFTFLDCNKYLIVKYILEISYIGAKVMLCDIYFRDSIRTQF